MGVSHDIFVSCALIDMYNKCGSIKDSQRVFDEMPEKTTVGWNTIIAGYALHGYNEEALDLNYEMQDAAIKIDHFTFSMIVRVCTRLASLEHAKQAHAGLIRHGLNLDIVANTALVDLYSKWGRIDDARNVFDKMPHPPWFHFRGLQMLSLVGSKITDGADEVDIHVHTTCYLRNGCHLSSQVWNGEN
ncbi:unnamed protein product [Lactuca saligna]|uniref:Pentatricopeptide repeat-containing protein n=1 Tax=Lactuca saligna TaxID=75948 RepID=A0AA36E6S2_LACSI|nr:unnamed protein product [Lactuca saligna]